MDRYAGVSRSGILLRKLEERLLSLENSPAGYSLPGDGSESAHQALVARLIVRAALLRTESRGVHWREDATAAGGSAACHLELSYDPGAQDKNDDDMLVHHFCTCNQD